MACRLVERSFLAARTSDAGSRRRAILIFAGVYFVFGRAPSTLAIWITMAVYGLYYALTQPVLKAMVVETWRRTSAGARWEFIFS